MSTKDKIERFRGGQKLITNNRARSGVELGLGIKKPVRSISGVTPLTVVLAPKKCSHGTCIYCPGGEHVPQSYTDKSPAIMRAMKLKYDPYEQVKVRLNVLKLMNKNATVENYAYVCYNFSQTKILVHGYLIYGFPGETINDCIESLEIVRQFFSLGILNSAFYHRFSLTIHSPVYKNPDDFGITIPQLALSSFSNNDVQYHEKKQSHIDQCGEGLNKAIYNFNYLNALDLPLEEWFPGIKFKHTIEPDFVKKCIKKSAGEKMTAIPVWTGNGLSLQKVTGDESFLTFSGTGDALSYQLPIDLATSFFNMLVSVDIAQVDINTGLTLNDWLTALPDGFFTSPDDLFRNELWHDLRKCGLILL